MDGNEKEDLIEQLEALQVLVSENPCRIPDGLLGSLADSIGGVFSRHVMKPASRDRVASYLERDVRTLSRWQQEYDDFPQPRHEGQKEVGYNWLDVVRWKLRHREIYKGR